MAARQGPKSAPPPAWHPHGSRPPSCCGCHGLRTDQRGLWGGGSTPCMPGWGARPWAAALAALVSRKRRACWWARRVTPCLRREGRCPRQGAGQMGRSPPAFPVTKRRARALSPVPTCWPPSESLSGAGLVSSPCTRRPSPPVQLQVRR